MLFLLLRSRSFAIATVHSQMFLYGWWNEIFCFGITAVSEQCWLNSFTLLNLLDLLKYIIVYAITNNRILSKNGEKSMNINVFILKLCYGLLIVWMIKDLFTHPCRCCHKFTRSALFYKSQVLFNCAMCIGIHFH